MDGILCLSMGRFRAMPSSSEEFQNQAMAFLERLGLTEPGKAYAQWSKRQRNDTILVLDGNSASWFIKRCGAPLMLEDVSLRNELLFHRRLNGGNFPPTLKNYVAKLIADGEDGRLLVFEGLSRHANLRTAFFDCGVDMCQIAIHMGCALALLHSTASVKVSGGFSIIDNPVLTFGHYTPEAIGQAPIYFELLQLIQADPQLNERLRELRASWHPTAIIHADIKADNILIGDTKDPKSRPVLVDWELVGLGDPRWDCGSFIGSLCYLWLESIGSDIKLSTDLDSPRRIQEAIRNFWDSYKEKRIEEPTFRAEKELGEIFGWAGYWLLQRVSMSLPLRRTLSAFDIGTLYLASHLLLNRSEDEFPTLTIHKTHQN
jgi:hypothetical protein